MHLTQIKKKLKLKLYKNETYRNICASLLNFLDRLNKDYWILFTFFHATQGK